MPIPVAGFQTRTQDEIRAAGAKGGLRNKGQKRVTAKKVRHALQKLAIGHRLIREAQAEIRAAFALEDA